MKEEKKLFNLDYFSLLLRIADLEEQNERLNNIINNAIEYIEKKTHNIYADGYRDRETGEILSIEKTPIVNRIFSENPQKLLEILNDRQQ